MKPFLKIPAVISNKDGDDKQVDARLQPEEIAEYYPGIYTGSVIVLKSGSSFFCLLSAEQLDDMLEKYAHFVKHKPNQFGFIEVTAKK
jgi:hypothetical protein